MKLYKIKTLFITGDTQEEALVGYLVANNDTEVYEYISDNIAWGEPWEAQYESGAKNRILEAHSDYEEEYMGEEYDQKYSWEEVDSISSEESRVLNKFNVLLH